MERDPRSSGNAEASVYTEFRYAQFLGTWTAEDVNTVYRAVEHVEHDSDLPEGRLSGDENRLDLTHRWVCVVNRMGRPVKDFYYACRFDAERGQVARTARTLASLIRNR